MKSRVMGFAVAAALGLSTAPAQAAPSLQFEPMVFEHALRSAASSNRHVDTFYAARGYRPIWVRNGKFAGEGLRILDQLRSAHLDGVNPRKLKVGRAEKLLDRAKDGSAEDLARADVALASALVTYVRALHRPGRRAMTYVDNELAPAPPSTHSILSSAAARQPLERIAQKHPIYLQMRAGYAAWLGRAGDLDRSEKRLQSRIRLNMERARLLPAPSLGRHIVVDAASARLWMYEGDKLRDTMKVVVGKPSEPTPMMAAQIRYAALNPYWNVPPDLVKVRIAPNVLSEGVSYLHAKGYEVLSDWSDNPRRVDPRTVDWNAVAQGKVDLPVRQLPGATNMMGAMKFMFPNALGVYLHDTPSKELFGQADRNQSSGCVRVEDAKRLAKWLFGKVPKARNSRTEQHAALPKPVPVFMTYLTVSPQAGALAFREDFYGRDGRGKKQSASTQLASNQARP